MRFRFRTIDLGPIWVYVLSFGALFLRFGYHYASGDQDEVLPFLMSLIDPSLFESDWFVQLQSMKIGVRTYVVWLLLPFHHLASLPTVVFGFHMACWLLIGSGLYRIANRLIGSRVGAAAAVFISLGVLHKWTLGSNDMVYTMFVGEMLAWGLAAHALNQWFGLRDRPAAVLLGIAAWFQLLVGLLIAGVLIFERIWDRTAKRSFAAHGKSDLLALGIFVLATLPAVIPIALQQIDAHATDSGRVFYILASFRAPFHYLFLSFGAKSFVRFGAMLVLGLASYIFLVRRRKLAESSRVLRLAAIILLACALTALFTEGWPVLLVAKFQAFKLTVLLKFLLVVLVSGVVAALIPGSARKWLELLVARGRIRASLSTIALVALVALAWSQPTFVQERNMHEVHMASDLGRMEAWVDEHVARDAVFAVPPSNSTFRSNARRAIVVDQFAVSFDDVDLIVWYDRLLDIAPIKPRTTGMGIVPVLDTAYHGLRPSDWIRLAAQYGIDYLLVNASNLEYEHGFSRVHQEGHWTLYRLPSP